MRRPIPWAITACLLLAPVALRAEDASRAAFHARAFAALPIEEPYTYHRTLEKGSIHKPRRDPHAKPTANELAIPADGWKVCIHARAGTPLRTAAQDLQQYLLESMATRVAWEERESLQAWPSIERTIIAATREQLPGCGQTLKGSKDYEIRVDGERIVVCGYDEAGAMHGLYHLEARLNLREAPLLPRTLHTVRHSRYRTRMALSWLGWMEWPDPYLSHMVHDGFDAIYASVYANPNGVAGPPHYDLIRQQDPKRMHDLLKRTARFGIKVYAPILYGYTGTPDNEAGLRDLVRDIVRKFPEIRGYILLTEGFYYQSFFGAGGHGKIDLRDWARHWSRAVEIVADECHKLDPKIDVLPWEYNIDFRPQQIELKRYVTSVLPPETIPLLTWENGKSFELDGRQGFLRDYSISRIGPAEVTEAQLAEAKKRGMRVFSKADTFATWQFGTTPYLPCPYQWQRRYDALAEAGLDGTLESWSNGYKPSFVTELRAWSCWTDALPLDELLRSVARRQFGSGTEDHVLEAWRLFSEAIQSVPGTGPSMGTNFAVANPLVFQPNPPRTMTLHHSWWDERKWGDVRRGSKLNPYWPYTHRRMVFYPDFNSHGDMAESYARARSGVMATGDGQGGKPAPLLPVFNKYLLLAADRFEAGLASYRRAALAAPPAKQATAFKEVLLVEQMQRMLRSTQAILEFEHARLQLSRSQDEQEKKRLLDRMSVVLAEERARTQLALDTARRDSRLGYECEQDYVYTPYVLHEKLLLLDETLGEQIPAYRRKNHL
ncbi:MAG TPA: hypothetical protein VIK18_25365 [Pirellulales bacterium]